MAAMDTVELLMARKGALDARIAEAPELAQRLYELRRFQAQRLAHTYEDLAHEPKHTAAVEFFLSDLYGPEGAARRDNDLRRAWRYFKPALPRAALEVLERAVALDVLSAELDLAMAETLAAGKVTAASYAAAYRHVGRAEDRERQIDRLIAVGEDLDRIVRHAWIGVALRAARHPAHTAGFGALQDFLERGFTAFRRMGGARELLATIRERETELMQALLGGRKQPFEQVGSKRAHS